MPILDQNLYVKLANFVEDAGNFFLTSHFEQAQCGNEAGAAWLMEFYDRAKFLLLDLEEGEPDNAAWED